MKCNYVDSVANANNTARDVMITNTTSWKERKVLAWIPGSWNLICLFSAAQCNMWPNTHIKLDAEDWPEDLRRFADSPEDAPASTSVWSLGHRGASSTSASNIAGISGMQINCIAQLFTEGPWSDAIRSQIFFLFASQGYAFLNLRNRWRQVLHNLNLCIFS